MSNASKINTVELTNAEIYELLDAITCTERENPEFLAARAKLREMVTEDSRSVG